MILNIPQTQALDYLQDDVTTELLFGGSAGPGKSTLGCYWQLKNRIKYPDTVGVLGRSTLKTLMETTVPTFHKVAKMQGVILGVHYKMYANKEFQFTNGSKILLKDLFYYPGDPDCDELGSLEITDAFIDEASQVNVTVKNVLKSRIRLMLDEYNLIPKLLLACNPGKNYVKTEFRDPWLNKTLPDFRKYVPALLSDNPNITKHYRQNLLDLPKHLKERLLYGNWDYNNDPTQLITPEALANIFTNVFIGPGAKKYITADVARFGKDRTIIRVWAGWRVISRHQLIKSSITNTAEFIKALAASNGIPMSQVLCDEDGVGGGLVDILKCRGFVANTVPFTEGLKLQNNKNFRSLKDQCGWWFADKANRNEIYDPVQDQSIKDSTIEELEWLKDNGMDKDKKNCLVPKDKIKEAIGRSPDDLDTFIMRAYFDLAPGLGMKIY